ncbi:MAG: MBL fold metallo-hydrolase [Lentisphaeraceae bacterium]|nr:MBL fold metallo-hydrolase [Lentisphaeraceae bacterium]
MNDKTLITFWGTRGSIATPGRSTEKFGGNTSCVSIKIDDQYFIFDAGTGIRTLGVEIMNSIGDFKEVQDLNVFLSHTHWDHIQGLPFFQPAYHPAFKLHIHGSPKRDIHLESVLHGQMDSIYFPVPMTAFGSEIQISEIDRKVIKYDKCEISFQELDHPGGSLSFKLKTADKTIVYATDHELNKHFNNDVELIDNSQLGKDYLDFISDADLLIADGQYTDEEYATKVGWGHSSISRLLKVAHKAKVKQVAVYHHDPTHTDKFLDELSTNYLHKYQDRKPLMEVFWAREGLTLAL